MVPGSSNLFRAIRLLLDDSMRRSSLKLEAKDFFRGIGDWRGHWIIVSIEFEEVSHDETAQALFLHGVGDASEDLISKATYNLIFRPNLNIRSLLSQVPIGNVGALNKVVDAINIEDYETILMGRSTCDFNDPLVYQELVGDFKAVRFPSTLNQPQLGGRITSYFSIANEICFTYVQALRDVVSEFHNNRTNPLFSLLQDKSGKINAAEFDPIIAQVNSLNSAIEQLNDVKAVRTDISTTIDDAVGDAYSPTSLSIKSGLSSEAEELFQSLRLFIAESDDGHEGAIHEMSLGGANLIYLTLKLLEFKYQTKKQSIANFLLIEEPEAHIHSHIQKSLFDKIQYPNTQVIYSTHSPQISEVSNISNVNILAKVSGAYFAFQPTTGLIPAQICRVQRYLDAVRCNLLFARSVILVEGDAEEILIPILIKQVLGVTLDELGISLINIRSTGFENVALLFHEDRIKKKCAIITDHDAPFIDVTAHPFDTEEIAKAKKKAQASATSGSNRKSSLDTLCYNNFWLKPFYAKHTFEVDLILAGNGTYFSKAVRNVYTDLSTITTAESEYTAADFITCAKRSLTMANHVGKGWFAITLGDYVNHNFTIPKYISDAIFFAHNKITIPTLVKIINYRLIKFSQDMNEHRAMLAQSHNPDPKWRADWDAYITTISAQISHVGDSLLKLQSNEIDKNQFRQLMTPCFPSDIMHSLFEHI